MDDPTMSTNAVNIRTTSLLMYRPRDLPNGAPAWRQRHKLSRGATPRQGRGMAPRDRHSYGCADRNPGDYLIVIRLALRLCSDGAGSVTSSTPSLKFASH